MKENNINCLDENYSTTRLVTKEKPLLKKNPDDKFETVLFLPEGEGRMGEGGLRTKGYFKKSCPDKPLITVITVVFNGEKYMEETILSVLNQTYDNVEYIIIDGCSTDGTLDIIKKYDNKIDYWVSEKDNGIYDAMNKGAASTIGDYVIYLNSDDIFLTSESVAKLVKETNGVIKKWFTGYIKIIDKDGRIIQEDKLISYSLSGQLIRNVIRHPASMVPLDYIKKNPFDIRFPYAADYLFFLRIWYDYGSPVFIKEYISGFRMTGSNASSDYQGSLYDEYRARCFFRKEKSYRYVRFFDFIIYELRRIKLKIKYLR